MALIRTGDNINSVSTNVLVAGIKTSGRSGTLVVGLLSIFILFLSISNAFAVETYRSIGMWPALTGPWYFTSPQGVAVDAAGNVYVADTTNNRIIKFNENGSLVTKWGSVGTGNGQFTNPQAVAVDAAGNVYVSDTTNNRIQKFDSSGTYLTKWGSLGAGNGQFSSPLGIAIDTSGNVYVTDTTNNRIQKFDSNGTYLTKWGTAGAGNGQFSSPQAIAIDSSNNVFVAETTNNRVQKFTSAGVWIAKWGATGTADGQFSAPRGIGVDSSGNVYVSETTNNRIQKFDSNGVFITKWGGTGLSDGMLTGPYKLAVSASGYVYVAEATNNRIQKFDTNGGFVAKWSSLWWDDGLFNSPYKLTISPARNIYVTDTSNNRIEKFSANGDYLAKWGSLGSGNGQFNSPQGIASDGAGNIYVADTTNHRIQKFDPNGVFLAKWGTYGTGNRLFNGPQAVAIDSSGNIYVADTTNNRIQKLDSSGAYITKWGATGAGNGQFNTPRGIAVDSTGNVYVVDTANNRVQKFDSNGTFLLAWGGTGAGNGQLNGPRSIAIDNEDDVYVADMTNNRIQKFDSGGGYLTKWGSRGPDDGQFYNPQGVTVDAYGNVYVADTGYHRIQRFSSEFVPPSTEVSTDPSDPEGTNDWFQTQPTIAFTANEPSATYYGWDGACDTTYTAPFIAPLGENTLSYYSVDEVGNIESLQEQQFKVDSGNPELTLTDPANGATGVTDVDTVTVSFSENIAAGPSYNMIGASSEGGAPINVQKVISGSNLYFRILSEITEGGSATFSIPADAITDPAGNPLGEDFEFSFTTIETAGDGGGSSGGGSPSNDKDEQEQTAREKLVKNVLSATSTVAEIPDLARIAIPGSSVTGNSVVVEINKLNGKVINTGTPLLSEVTEIKLKDGFLSGSIILSVNYNKNALKERQTPQICRYNREGNKLMPLGGTVDEHNGIITAIVSELGQYVVTGVTKDVPDIENTYKDMGSHWAADAVGRLVKNDIVTGYKNETFKPDSSLSRAELAVILARALKLDQKTGEKLIFEDNRKIPLWARSSIESLMGENIVTGIKHRDAPGLLFKADRPVTRAQFAVVVARAIKSKTGVDIPLSDVVDFDDDMDIPTWSREAVNIATSMNLMNGYPGDCFCAHKHASRAEAASIVCRMLDLLQIK